MKLTCPNCGSPVPPAGINIEKTLAVCPQCGEVFDFAGMIPIRKRKERKLKPPAGIQVSETDHSLSLVVDTLPPNPVVRLTTRVIYGLMALAGVVLSGLVINAAGFSVASLFLLLPVLLLIYAGIGGIFNRVRIRLDEDSLRVNQGPLPLMVPKRFARASVVGVSSQVNLASAYYNAPVRTHGVDVHLANGAQHLLLQNIRSEYAAFIVQELEHDLHDDAEAPLTAAPDLFDEAAQPETTDADLLTGLDTEQQTRRDFRR